MLESRIDRRTLLKLAGSSLIYLLGSEVCYGALVTPEKRDLFAKSIAHKLAADLPTLDGVFVFDQAVREQIAVDFGHFIHKVPLGILAPGSRADVQAMLTYAYENEIPITMRGTGGSAYGQSQTENGILIDSALFNKMEWVSDSLVKVGAGVLWIDVLDFTIRSQKTPPVLPDTMFISVGGTLNAAGIGETTYRCGAQIDNVVSLEVVTTTGGVFTCSPSEQSEIFYAMLGGMGQCGFILSATLVVVDAPESVHTQEFKYSGTNSATYLEDINLFAQNEILGAIGGHLTRDTNKSTFTYVLEVSAWGNNSDAFKIFRGQTTGKIKTWTFYDYANRNTQSWRDAIKSGAAFFPHPYIAFFMPAETTAGCIQYLLSNASANLGATRIALFPIINSKFRQALQAMPRSQFSFHIRIYRVVQDGSGSANHMEMLSSNQEEILPLVLQNGGTMYLPFSPPLNAQEKVAHFGEEIWNQFTSSKQNLDPKNLLTQGAKLF